MWNMTAHRPVPVTTSYTAAAAAATAPRSPGGPRRQRVGGRGRRREPAPAVPPRLPGGPAAIRRLLPGLLTPSLLSAPDNTSAAQLVLGGIRAAKHSNTCFRLSCPASEVVCTHICATGFFFMLLHLHGHWVTLNVGLGPKLGTRDFGDIFQWRLEAGLDNCGSTAGPGPLEY